MAGPGERRGVLARVAKLLALAGSAGEGGEAGEARQAADRAARLIERYQLREEEVAAARGEGAGEVRRTVVASFAASEVDWVTMLARALALLSRCDVMIGGDPDRDERVAVVVVGRRRDAERVRLGLAPLVAEMVGMSERARLERLDAAEAGTRGRGRRRRRHADEVLPMLDDLFALLQPDDWRRSYAVGVAARMVTRVEERLARRRAAAEAGGKGEAAAGEEKAGSEPVAALVRLSEVEDAVAAEIERMARESGGREHRIATTVPGAARAGYEAGDRLSLGDPGLHRPGLGTGGGS